MESGDTMLSNLHSLDINDSETEIPEIESTSNGALSISEHINKLITKTEVVKIDPHNEKNNAEAASKKHKFNDLFNSTDDKIYDTKDINMTDKTIEDTKRSFISKKIDSSVFSNFENLSKSNVDLNISEGMSKLVAKQDQEKLEKKLQKVIQK